MLLEIESTPLCWYYASLLQCRCGVISSVQFCRDSKTLLPLPSGSDSSHLPHSMNSTRLLALPQWKHRNISSQDKVGVYGKCCGKQDVIPWNPKI